MTHSVIPILYINLDRAVERRRHIEDQIHATFPAGTYAMHRIAAVDGASVDADNALTPYAHLALVQPSLIQSNKQIESWGAVGCYLSHVKCWEWLLEQDPRVEWCFVLEDDACFPPRFYDRVWQDPIIRGYIREPVVNGGWDVVALGYFAGRGLENRPTNAPSDLTVKGVRRGGSFYGTHAYLVSRRGAARLRMHALPMEVQVDAYMLVLDQLGWIKLVLIDAVTQCKGSTEGSIDHWFAKSKSGWSARILAAALVVLVVIGALAVVARRRKGGMSPSAATLQK